MNPTGDHSSRWPALEALLSHPDPDMRRVAALELEQDHGITSTAALAAALSDPHKGVRDAAAHSLSSIGGREAARIVVEYLASENIVTRNLASSLLVAFGEASVQAVLPYLQDPDRDIRKFAADILGLIGARSSVTPLLPLLKDSDENVVVSVVEALGNIGDPRALLELLVAYHAHDFARACVLEALGKLGSQDASPFLISVFHTEVANPQRDPLTMFTLLEAMQAVGNEDAYNILRSHRTALDGPLRHSLIRAYLTLGIRCGITPTGVQDVREDVLQVCSDPAVVPTQPMTAMLASFQGRDVTKVLVGLMGRSEDLDAAVIEHLLLRDDTLPEAVEALGTASSVARGRIVRLLTRIAVSHEGIAVRILYSPDAGDLLRRTSDALAGAWETADEETRSLIVETMFRFDGDYACAFFERALAEADPWITVQVLEWFSRVQQNHVNSLLFQYANHEEEMVREIASGLIAQRGLMLSAAAGIPDDGAGA